MLDEPLSLQFGEDRERFDQRSRGGTIEATHAQVDDVEAIQAQVRQVVANGLT